MGSLDIDGLREWVGRTETLDDVVTTVPLQAMAATLDRSDAPWAAGSELPPLWHWLYFLPVRPQAEIGPDGHPKRGGFLPPVPLPRRMWAGSRLEFLAPIRPGQAVRRTSRIGDVRLKEGRTGPLVFVTVHHEIEAAGERAILEQHDIVYRDLPRAGEPVPAPLPAPGPATWKRRVVPDPVLLFRYSALTFNGHRIHYDRSYVTQEEGYPGLIVHGPLIATLLLDLLHRERPDARVRRFEFKAVKPLFDIEPFDVGGQPGEGGAVNLWAQTASGHLAMDAKAVID